MSVISKKSKEKKTCNKCTLPTEKEERDGMTVKDWAQNCSDKAQIIGNETFHLIHKIIGGPFYGIWECQ